MPQILFGVESYRSRSLPVSAQRLVNGFMERQPESAKSQVPVFGTPGLTDWTLLPKRPVRGLWNFNGVLYAVAGDTLYRINSSGGIKAIGAGITGTGQVSMSDNGTQIIVVNGVSGFVADAEDNYQQIQNPNFYSASRVIFFDNYFVFDRKSTNQFFLSNLSNGLAYNGLDFASAEAQPGFLTAPAQNVQLLFLFSVNHIETWYDAGTADFPFQRYQGGVIEKGCNAAYSIVNQDEAIFFLCTDGVIYRLDGNVPKRISTHAIEHDVASFGDVSDCFALTYTIEGHKIVAFTFPSAPDGGRTYQWDISTSLWHERASRDANGVELGRWRANCAIKIYDKILIGDAFDGMISYLDWDNYTERGNPMQFKVCSAPIHQDRLPVFVGRLELDMQTGYGQRPGGQGPTTTSPPPVALLRWSKNSGYSWSALQQPRSLGNVGEYVTRLRWLSMGRAYSWVFELTISDPVPRVLVAAHGDVDVGMG